MLTLCGDLVVAADRDGQLPAVRELRELMLAQSRTLVRQEQRREAHARAQRVKDTLIRHQVSPLNERKRQAQGVVAVSTGLAALGAVLRSVAVPPFNEAGAGFIGPFLGVLALLVAVTGGAAFVLSQHAQRMARHVEDASEILGDMPSCLEILDEIEAAGDGRSPWTASRFAEAIEVWAHSSDAEEATVAALAATVGGREFRRLLSASAVQHGLLVEDLTAEGERHHTIYRREFRRCRAPVRRNGGRSQDAAVGSNAAATAEAPAVAPRSKPCGWPATAAPCHLIAPPHYKTSAPPAIKSSPSVDICSRSASETPRRRVRRTRSEPPGLWLNAPPWRFMQPPRPKYLSPAAGSSRPVTVG
jgi:hypothetical protein